jgi:peptidoglycan/xylan/chitin deacetylase (PgdA/CDA1 family)
MKLYNTRLFMLSWIFIPLLLVWLSTGYIIGLSRKPVWSTNREVENVLASTSNVEPQVEMEKLHYKNNGLVTFWFDDAWLSQFTVAYPILEENDMRAALAVPTGMVGYEDYMSWNQVKLLQNKGWEVTSHTVHHSCEANEITEAYITQELTQSLKELNAHGLVAQHFVTPCGLNAELVTKVAKDHYLSLRSTNDGLNELPIKNPYNLKVMAVDWKNTPEEVQGWIDQAKKENLWIILMFHQIQNEESRFASTPDKLKKIVQIVKDSGIQVALPTQAIQLVMDSPVTTPTTQESTPSQNVTATPSNIFSSLANIPVSGSSVREVIIDTTPEGYVNVYAEPNINSTVIAKVNTGETYKLIESTQNWYKIEVDSAKKTQGWISINLAYEKNDNSQ